MSTRQFSKIRVSSEAEFERLCDRIDLQASKAADHFNLVNALSESREEYYLEMNESHTFWYMTIAAHRMAVLSHLCKIFDKDHGALSLGRFLHTVRANREFFSDAAFRARLKDNPHLETLAGGRVIDDVELDSELESVSGSDALVRKLWDVRDKELFHTDADRVRRDTPTDWLYAEQVEALLQRARTITSKYSLLYRASMYGGIAGADDYKSTLRMLRKAISLRRGDAQLPGVGPQFE